MQWFQEPDTYPFQVFWNIFCLLAGMTIGSFMEKRKENRAESTALGDIKSTLSGGLIYTILVSILLLTYYSKIDPDYNKQQVEVAKTQIDKMLDTEKGLKQTRESRPEFKSMTKEEIAEKLYENVNSMFSPRTVFTISLLGMLLLSTINSLVLTVVYRRFIFRN